MSTLHGGIAATILDDIVGTMVYALGREFAYTSVNLNCDFLNPAVVGDVLDGQISGDKGWKKCYPCGRDRLQTAWEKLWPNVRVTSFKRP
jgi:hypothetical protein